MTPSQRHIHGRRRRRSRARCSASQSLRLYSSRASASLCAAQMSSSPPAWRFSLRTTCGSAVTSPLALRARNGSLHSAVSATVARIGRLIDYGSAPLVGNLLPHMSKLASFIVHTVPKPLLVSLFYRLAILHCASRIIPSISSGWAGEYGVDEAWDGRPV